MSEEPRDEVAQDDDLAAADVAPATAGDEDAAEGDVLDDQADSAEDFLNGLLDVLDLEGEAEADIDEDTIYVEIHGSDLALLIGRHGATLEALQELTRAAVQHQTQERARMILDIGGYRTRQREMLERRARTAATKVRSTRQAVPLEPMNAYERRIVHTALVDFTGVVTVSEGEDASRHVVIKPA
ncbi:MAG TPA: RNA-binding cell elongation regulator Jag/EloR [Actinomycetota bacterium]|nr:RNA-binding cell elongation regulator Jag/EloR [Actinomycetota bacterium]